MMLADEVAPVPEWHMIMDLENRIFYRLIFTGFTGSVSTPQIIEYAQRSSSDNPQNVTAPGAPLPEEGRFVGEGGVDEPAEEVSMLGKGKGAGPK